MSKKVLAKTLIMGIGNPILTDDGVGILVGKMIKKQVPDVNFIDISATGLAILDEMEGYDRVIIIDSVKTGEHEPGKLIKISLDDLSSAVNLSTYHNVNLPTALEFGDKYYKSLPSKDNISIYGIEIEDNITFSEKLTEKVGNSVDSIVSRIIREELNA